MIVLVADRPYFTADGERIMLRENNIWPGGKDQYPFYSERRGRDFVFYDKHGVALNSPGKLIVKADQSQGDLFFDGVAFKVRGEEGMPPEATHYARLPLERSGYIEVPCTDLKVGDLIEFVTDGAYGWGRVYSIKSELDYCCSVTVEESPQSERFWRGPDGKPSFHVRKKGILKVLRKLRETTEAEGSWSVPQTAPGMVSAQPEPVSKVGSLLKEQLAKGTHVPRSAFKPGDYVEINDGEAGVLRGTLVAPSEEYAGNWVVRLDPEFHKEWGWDAEDMFNGEEVGRILYESDMKHIPAPAPGPRLASKMEQDIWQVLVCRASVGDFSTISEELDNVRRALIEQYNKLHA